MLKLQDSIAEQIFKVRPRRRLARSLHFLRHPLAAGKFKIFAEVADGLFQHRYRTAFAALLRHAWIVARAVQAHAQVRTAFHANFAATGLAGNDPGFTADLACLLYTSDA